MRKFFCDLSGKEAPSVLDVGFGAAGRALGIVKRGAQNVAVVFKKPSEEVQLDSFILFNRTIESIHSVVVLLTHKKMDSVECSQLQRAQEVLQHMAQHLQVQHLYIFILHFAPHQTRLIFEILFLAGVSGVRARHERWLTRQVHRRRQLQDRLHVPA